jgi:hypothetical protein
LLSHFDDIVQLSQLARYYEFSQRTPVSETALGCGGSVPKLDLDAEVFTV